MKNTAIIVAIMLASSSAIAQISPKNDDWWYVGGKLGWSQFHNINRHSDYLLNNDSLIYKNQPGTGIFGGYRINSHFNLEVGYDWLDRVIYKGKNNISDVFKSHGVQLVTKINYPVTKNLDVYTRLGGMVWRANYSSIDDSVANYHDTGISPVLAGGIEWAIDSNVTSRLEYQWINNIGDSNTVGTKLDNGMLSLGISYHFDQGKNISKVVTLPTSVSNSREQFDKHFSLKSSVLFDFNEAILRPESQQILDQLSTKLNNLNSINYSVIVTGFADHIGSSTYNQQLSEKRSQSVVKYLINRGIPEGRISSRGVGSEHNSITGNICNSTDTTTKSKLVNCLAPDRRVEIEIKGTK